MSLLLPRVLAAVLLLTSVQAAAQSAPADQTDDRATEQRTADTDEGAAEVADTDTDADAAAQEQAAAEAMVNAARERVQQVLRDSAVRLEAELASRSEQVGAYDVELAELQADLGRIYLEMGEYESATGVLQQALQLLRINRGLYDAGQIGVLEQLVASYRGQSDWENVDNYQHLVFSLQSRAYAPDSAEYANAVLAMGDWQVMSARAGINGRSGSFYSVERLSELKDLYASVRTHAEQRGDVMQQWEIAYSSALVDVEIARQYLSTDLSDMMVSASRYVTQTVCRMVSDGNGGFQRVCWQESVNNPDYYRQVNSQRRTQIERARVNLQRARNDMQTLMDNNPDFVAQNTERTGAGMQNLTDALEDLQRESRRATLGGFW